MVKPGKEGRYLRRGRCHISLAVRAVKFLPYVRASVEEGGSCGSKWGKNGTLEAKFW